MLVRIGGASAIVGGLLRIIDSFAAEALSQSVLALLYLVTDVFLLAGIAGLWLRRRGAPGIAGTVGVAIFVAGILAIRASAFGAFGTGGYQWGASVALIGLAIYSVETLIQRSAAPFAPMLWLASLACGIAGAVGFAPQFMLVAAGVTFGAGFVAAGVEMLRR